MKRILHTFALAAAVLAAAIASAQTEAVKAPDKEEQKQILSSLERILTETAFVPGADFSRWPEMISTHEEQLAKSASHGEFSYRVNSVLQEFGFSHVALFPPSFGEARTSQRRAGIGIRIQEEEGGLRVIRVFPESPAEAAGILIGDLIFNADGNPIRRVTDLAGEKGDTSVIKVLRRDEEIEIEVTRGEYKSILPETLTWKNRTAIIEIPTFDVGYNAKRIDELMEEAMSAEMIVLDLRSNGGGRVVNLQHLMGWFLDRTEEPMGTFIGRSAVNRYKRNNEVETIDLIEVADATRAKVRAGRRDGKNFEGAIAVLQSGATGSASEMAAAALQHYRGAAIIGTQSAGAVLASMIIPLPDGSDYWVQFPVTDYVTIAGDRLEGSGIKPDIAAAPPTYDKDEGVERALEWLAIIKTVRNLDR